MESVEGMGRWFRRRGWIGEEQRREVVEGVKEGRGKEIEEQDADKGGGQMASRVLVEVATAYAIVKFLMPLRLVLSAFWAPGFARMVVIPISAVGRRAWASTKTVRTK